MKINKIKCFLIGFIWLGPLSLKAYQVVHLDPNFQVVHLDPSQMDKHVRVGAFASDADMQKSQAEPAAEPTSVEPNSDAQIIKAEIAKSDELLEINFSDVSLASVFKIIAEKRNWNYVLAKELQGLKVSLKMDEPVTLDKAWEIFLTLLDLHGFVHVQVDHLHKIMPSAQAASEPFPLYSSAKGDMPDDLPDDLQTIRYIYFLKNLRFNVAADILNVLLSEKVQTVADLEVCIVKDKSLNVKHAFKLIKELDEGGVRQAISIVPLNHADPDYVADFLNKNFVDNKQGAGERIRFVGGNRRSVSYFSSDVKILSNKFHNAVIYLGPEKDIERFRNFVTLLIDHGPETAGSRVHIKDIKYHEADVLGDLLRKLTAQPANATQQTYFKDVLITAESNKGSGSSTSGNRLIISCMPEDWVRIEKLIDDLDKPQAQVALEIMIVDTTVDFNEELEAHIRDTGLNLFGEDVSWRVNNFASNLEFSSTNTAPKPSYSPKEKTLALSLNEGSPTGNSWWVLGGANSDASLSNKAWAFIKAFISKDNSAIIAQPFLITNNNQPANFTSTDKARVYGEFVSSSNKMSRKDEYMPAMTKVDITPRINSTGIVDLDIDLAVSDFISRDKAQAKTNDRRLKTKVSMALGEVLGLGGLVKSKISQSEYKTPILGDIPVLGLLFRGKSKQTVKSKLYMFIRPSIIKPRVNADPDDYTALKLKYAKYQIGNVNTYAQSKDPVEHFFFKPTGHTVAQTISDYQNNRFNYIDDFSERKYMPTSTILDKDPFYSQQEEITDQVKKDMVWVQPADNATPKSSLSLDLDSRA